MAELNKPVYKDGRVEISVLPNNNEAYVYLFPPEGGGKKATKQDILNALKDNNIIHGIHMDIIDLLITNERYEQKMCVASAVMPIDGENGDVTYKFDKKVENTPVENERGFVNYKDLGLVRTIYTNDVIADIKLPTNGEPGTNVRGVRLAQSLGKKAAFSLGTNTKLTDDGLHIIATADGNLVYKNGAFNVESVVIISGDVDSAVGNISFIGDVVIRGNVFEGFKVASNSNITISGDANGAILESGGDIIIKKGCINTNITAHGSVSAQFFEYCKIKCDGDVSAQNYVICDTYCGGTLITKSSKGGIIGGRHVILNNVEAITIGSKNYVPTEITLGDNALLAEEKNNLLKSIENNDKKLTDLILVVNYLNEKKKEKHRLSEEKELMLGSAARQKIMLNVENKNAQKRIKEIDLSLEKRQMLSISCRGYIYPGTKITINDVIFKIDDEYVRSVIGLNSDGEITVSPL